MAGFLVMAAAGALYVYLADEVGEQAWLTRVDSMAAQFFTATASRGWCNAFEAVTLFGNPSTMAVISVASRSCCGWTLLLVWAGPSPAPGC